MAAHHLTLCRRPPTSLTSTLQRYERYLYAKRGLSEVTVYNHTSALRRLEPVLGLNPTEDQVEKLMEKTHKNGASFSHISNTTTSIETYFGFLGRSLKLGRPRKPKHLIRGTLSEAEVTLLIAAGRNLRERTIMATLAYAGLRNRELCRLRIRDANISEQYLHISATKTQKDRQAHIAPACVQILSEYLRERQGAPDDMLFITLRNGLPYEQQCLRKMIRKAAKRAGLTKRVYPHLLRHSLATNLLLRGAHLIAIKDQLGHAFITTTMIYVHSNPELARKHYHMYSPSYL